jgi:hypothetical protein
MFEARYPLHWNALFPRGSLSFSAPSLGSAGLLLPCALHDLYMATSKKMQRTSA